MKNKGWSSLTVKLNVLILVIVLVLSLGLASFAYQTNSERVDNIYKKNTSRAAAAVAAFVNGYSLGTTSVTFGGTKAITGTDSTTKVFTFELYETGADFAIAANQEPIPRTSTRTSAWA